MRIEIKSRVYGSVLFAGEFEDKRAAVKAAVKADADLRWAYLDGADLSGAHLSNADLSGAHLSGADLRNADLRNADLRNAHLSNADLSGADLRGAHLSGADLRWADLRWAYLDGADLSGAYLDGADLSGAHLSNADLRGANLRDADLPSPTMMLLASWGGVSPKLCTELMRYDAANCPDGKRRFAKWAKGGVCPYEGLKIQRAAHFTERSERWRPGPAKSAYELMVMLIREKCADSDYHKKKKGAK